MGIGADCIIDPDGGGPRIWFQVVPEQKTVKNRFHLDVHVSGGRAVPIETRRQRVDAEAQRLADLGATMVGVLRDQVGCIEGWRRKQAPAPDHRRLRVRCLWANVSLDSADRDGRGGRDG